MTHKEISRKGGRARTPAKLKAARRNAKKARATLAAQFYRKRT